ncbi:MAG: hypothetical protein ACE5Q6_00840 [Dehalococcoidia bacterium]
MVLGQLRGYIDADAIHTIIGENRVPAMTLTPHDLTHPVDSRLGTGELSILKYLDQIAESPQP